MAFPRGREGCRLMSPRPVPCVGDCVCPEVLRISGGLSRHTPFSHVCAAATPVEHTMTATASTELFISYISEIGFTSIAAESQFVTAARSSENNAVTVPEFFPGSTRPKEATMGVCNVRLGKIQRLCGLSSLVLACNRIAGLASTGAHVTSD